MKHNEDKSHHREASKDSNNAKTNLANKIKEEKIKSANLKHDLIEKEVKSKIQSEEYFSILE
jgi:hypothetical protein